MQKGLLDLEKVKSIVVDNIDVLLDDLDIEYTKNGDTIHMCCPIHGGDNPTGLSFSLDKKTWKCWTHGCHENFQKDIFGFVYGVKNCNSFSELLKYLRSLYSFNNANRDSSKSVKKEENDFDNYINIFSKSFDSEDVAFNERVDTLNNSFYFEKRGFLPETLEHFGIKDCIDKNSKMFNRSIIPVNFRGKQIGYIARATKSFIKPKYLFSNGLQKSKYLYNYDNAIKEIERTHALFLVEGQGDVWRLYECGVKNAVGLFGKEISKYQKSLLINSGATTIIVLTDNDQAGREGRIKIQRELNRMFKLVYPPMTKKDIGDMTVKTIQKNILVNLRGLY